MRRLWILLLALMMAVQAFPIAASADYVVGSEDRGKSDFYEYSLSKPFEVEIKDRSSRYALDVVYDALHINVDSAIWNVNDHVYNVTMNSDLTFGVTLVNHSDLPVYVKITPTSAVEGISFLQDPIFNNRVTVPAAVPIMPGNDTAVYDATLFEASAAGYITSVITAYSDDWQSVVNRIIMSDQIQGGEYTVGQLRIEFSRS